MSKKRRGRGVSRELEVLREEYWRIRTLNPYFEDPDKSAILLNLIINRIEVLEGEEKSE
jgi:hypothetical protein